MPTSLMNLETSIVNVTSDQQAAINEQANIQTIDVHDHSPGKGAKVPTAGLNINADLNFAGFKGFNFLATQFANQTGALASAANRPCLYSLNGELRFIDNAGNDVQITTGGAVVGPSGTIAGLSSPVSAGFASGTFTWQANSGTGLYAKMASSDIILYDATAGATNAVTIKSPAALASSYNVTMPASLPGSTQYLSISSAGVLAPQTADAIGTAMTATGANAVANTRSRSVATSAALGNVAISNNVASVTVTGVTETDVAGLTCTLVVSGTRPVIIQIVTAQGASQGFINVTRATSGANAIIIFYEGATKLSTHSAAISTSGTSNTLQIPASAFQHLEGAFSAGSKVFKIAAQSDAAATSILFQNVRLIAYEL